MQQRLHAGFAPAGCNDIKIVVKLPKNDVAVAVNQRRGSTHRIWSLLDCQSD